MTAGTLDDPLHRFPTVRTSDPEEFEHAVITKYGATGLVVPDPAGLQTRGNFIHLQNTGVGFSACGARAIVSFAECDFARMQIALSGHAATTSNGVTTTVSTRESCVTSPGLPAALDYGQGFEHLVLRVNVNALARKLTKLLGAAPTKPVIFNPSVKNDTPRLQGLNQLLLFFMGQLNATSRMLSSAALHELEQAIVIAFLYTARHNYSEFLESDVKDTAPLHVRRAEEYIEANWNQAITIGTLIEITGVSGRTLFKAFQRSRGYSPMAFVKQLRLRKANALLSDPDHSTTVTGVAFACSFSNLGHFAKDYRDAFGELPSETLHRQKPSASNTRDFDMNRSFRTD